MSFKNSRLFRHATLIIFLAVLSSVAVADSRASYPPLAVEISATRPLFLFQDLPAYRGDAERQKEHVLRSWAQVPDEIRAQSILKIAATTTGEAMGDYYDAILSVLQEPQIPTVIRIADDPQHARLDPDLLEGLLRAHTMVRGIEVTGLDFRFYDSPRMLDGQTPVVIEWLTEVIDIAARYGRFIYIPLDELQWARVMSNTACTPLYKKLVACQDYVIPACHTRGDHVLGNLSSVMGLWLEGAVSQWGMAADAQWYSDNSYVSPGVFGDGDGTAMAPPQLYRAMILNGAMTGATVYSFEHGPDLWYGPQRAHWDNAILPTLLDLMPQRLVARKDFVQRRARVGLQLVAAPDPESFHLNLKDIDGVLDAGNMIKAAYGLERPGQIAELIPNRGDLYWIPFLSSHAPESALSTFDRVFPVGRLPTLESWREALRPFRVNPDAGSAFVSEVGRNLYVMNTRENVRERQTYTIAGVAAPVRGFGARRDNDAVIVSWEFRENDVQYRVYRRQEGEPEFTLISRDLEAEIRSYIDTTVNPEKTVTYAVTAITDEQETITGTVGFGEYKTFSMIESRIAEEVVLSPVLIEAKSTPVKESAIEGEVVAPWWPDYRQVSEAQRPAAEAIVEQIELLESAFTEKNLNGIMAVYGTAYTDPEGWGFQYVQRAYQWLLERYRAVALHRQIRQWDFSNLESGGEVNVMLYLRVTAVALTDSSGLRADVTIALPRTPVAEVWTKWSNDEGVWRLVGTNPAMPNFREILSFEAGPYDNFPLGPDRF